MHKRLLQLLPGAVGSSRHVLVVFIDVREFSKYAGHAESVEAAVYLKKLYKAILLDYFPEADFVKPTGDGLMIIQCFDENELVNLAVDSVLACKRLIENYAKMFGDDPMLTQDIPEHLGIGVALGAATRLGVEDETIDYSGRPLNLAARLMDLARPQGVVLDRRTRLALGDSPVADELICDDRVHIKGVADDEAIEVYFFEEWTVLPQAAHFPTGEYDYFSDRSVSMTVPEMQDSGMFHFRLTHQPSFEDEVKIKVLHPALRSDGTKMPNQKIILHVPAEFIRNSEGMLARADLPAIADILVEGGVKIAWPIDLSPEYRIPKGTGGTL